MAAALEAKGLDHELHLYEGEDHGFRRAETGRPSPRPKLAFLDAGGRLSRLVSELNLILIGPPGAGKGTQADHIKDDFDLPYLATGDMMRAARKEDSDLGRKIDKIINEGGLVDDDIVCKVLIERIEDEGEDGFLLDGFPRTRGQADILDDALAERGRAITAVLLIEAPDDDDRRAHHRPPHVPRRPRLPRRVQPSGAGGRLRRRRQAARAARRRQARDGREAPGDLPRADRAAGRALRGRGRCCAASTAPSRPDDVHAHLRRTIRTLQREDDA